jgi:hypothetical protein
MPQRPHTTETLSANRGRDYDLLDLVEGVSDDQAERHIAMADHDAGTDPAVDSSNGSEACSDSNTTATSKPSTPGLATVALVQQGDLQLDQLLAMDTSLEASVHALQAESCRRDAFALTRYVYRPFLRERVPISPVQQTAEDVVQVWWYDVVTWRPVNVTTRSNYRQCLQCLRCASMPMIQPPPPNPKLIAHTPTTSSPVTSSAGGAPGAAGVTGATGSPALSLFEPSIRQPTRLRHPICPHCGGVWRLRHSHSKAM